MKKTQTPSEYYKAACDYVEKYHGTRAANYIEEGNQSRAELKAELLNEYVELTKEMETILHNYPAMAEHVKFSFTFTD